MIIGITGTIGAGKGTVVQELVGRYGFVHASARSFIEGELERRGLPLTRDHMASVANELRRLHHSAYIVEQLYAAAEARGGDAVIESIRTLGEIALLREKPGFILLAVDADPHVRYDRIRLRGSSTDDVTFERFLADEEREAHATDPGMQNLSGCRALADYVIENNGTREDLSQSVDRFMEESGHGRQAR